MNKQKIKLDDVDFRRYNIKTINLEYIYSDQNPFIKRLYTQPEYFLPKIKPSFTKAYLKKLSQDILDSINKILYDDNEVIDIKFDNVKFLTEEMLVLSKEYTNDYKDRLYKNFYINFHDHEDAKNFKKIISSK